MGIIDKFLKNLNDLPYDEFFIESCGDQQLEDKSDDVIREKLMDGYCMNVAEYMYEIIPNLDKFIRCYYVECKDGFDFHFVFYCPEYNRYFDAYHCTYNNGVEKLSDLEFIKKYNRPYKYVNDDFPGRSKKLTEEELKELEIDCTEDAIKKELYKYANNLSYIRKKREEQK